MPLDGSIPDIEHIIQLAVAPVFLLAGIGAFINAFAGRLARIVDRSRAIASQLGSDNTRERTTAQRELERLRRRAHMVYIGMTLGISSALLVCTLIVVAFSSHFLETAFPEAIALLFVAAMLALIGALLAFLREVFLGVRGLTVNLG
ncbi:MAG: hypothetical protein AMS22_02905 [Thiotrichales bacterium SG8_50]|nr:MAG: hypothetical protein AMS22_02905 [Thiotrichales bacterium SG8_50]